MSYLSDTGRLWQCYCFQQFLILFIKSIPYLSNSTVHWGHSKYTGLDMDWTHDRISPRQTKSSDGNICVLITKILIYWCVTGVNIKNKINVIKCLQERITRVFKQSWSFGAKLLFKGPILLHTFWRALKWLSFKRKVKQSWSFWEQLGSKRLTCFIHVYKITLLESNRKFAWSFLILWI